MKVVVLAGGSGTRLWPLSRKHIPKQFLKLWGTTSLLQKTVLRFYPDVPVEDLLIVTHQDYAHLVREHLRVIDPELEHRILMEPCRKSTGPAIMMAVKYLMDIEAMSPQDMVVVTPSDHSIHPETGFSRIFATLEPWVDQGKIVTLGIPPDRPETGYGYIECDLEARLASASPVRPYRVKRFVEKPSFQVAQQYLEAGCYLWNSGMFALTADTLMQQVRDHSPVLREFVDLSFQEMQRQFSSFPTTSIDVALMERTPHLVVVPLEQAWSDVGSWDRLFDILKKDEHHNAIVGNVHQVDTSNTLIYGGKRLISTMGLTDMIIVDTDDVLFIGKRGASENIKQLVETLEPCTLK